MKSAVVLPTMVREWACGGCNDYAEEVNGKWRHVTTKPYPDLHAVRPIRPSECECHCDKIGGWSGKMSCICHQWCYVPAVCAACEPNGCEGGMTRVEAQSMMASAINEALTKAGADDIEVVPEDIMAGIHGPRTRKKIKN